MKKLIIAAILFVSPVKAADYAGPGVTGAPPLSFELEEQKALDRLPEPLVQGMLFYKAHSYIASSTLQLCERYPLFMELTTDSEIEELNYWRGIQFDQQVIGGISQLQQQAIVRQSVIKGKELVATANIPTPVAITTEKRWCEHKGSVLFNASIKIIQNPNFENFLRKKDAWVQATQDLSSLTFR